MRVVFNSLSIIKNSVSKPNLVIFSPGKRFQPQLFHFPIFFRVFEQRQSS